MSPLDEADAFASITYPYETRTSNDDCLEDVKVKKTQNGLIDLVIELLQTLL